MSSGHHVAISSVNTRNAVAGSQLTVMVRRMGSITGALLLQMEWGTVRRRV
jgi:hypothetical protein